MKEAKEIYQIQLMDSNLSPICDGVIKFFVDSLEDFETNWIPLMQNDKNRVERYFKSKSGELITDYYSDDPDLNIVQKKKCDIIAEKSYTESDVTKIVENIYGFESMYHIDEITYFLRYVKIDDELLKLCQYQIRGICYDEGKSYWLGKKKEKYERLGFEAVKHLINEEYLPAYHIFENGEHVAAYHPRYSNPHVYGNEFIKITKTDTLLSDNTDIFRDIHADLFVWHIVKSFKDEKKMQNNIKHYKLGKLETQVLLMDFPGEAG